MTNILLIVADQLRADITYHERYPFVRTPNIDVLRDSSINVPNTFSQYPICGPARASLLTGRYPQQHGVLNNRSMLPADERTMGHHFRDHGFDAIAFGKTHGHNVGFRRVPEPLPPARTLGDEEGGFFRGQSMVAATTAASGDDLEPLTGVFDHPLESHYDYIVNQQIRTYLAERDPARPFLMWVGYHTPHPPLFPPRHLAGLYPPDEIDLPFVPEDEHVTKPAMQRRAGRHWRALGMEARKALIAAYLALITHVDECIGHLLQILEERGLLDDTVVVLTSDHGEQLGEHDMIGKLNSLYDGSLRVPLMFRLPGAANRGLQVPHLVEQIDIYPTICDLVGVSKPASLSGKSLVPLFSQPDAEHRTHVNAMTVDGRASAASSVGGGEQFPRGQMVRTDRWKLSVYVNDQGELYDLANDPNELVNLFDDPDYRDVKLTLYELMLTHALTYTRDPTNYGYNQYPP